MATKKSSIKTSTRTSSAANRNSVSQIENSPIESPKQSNNKYILPIVIILVVLVLFAFKGLFIAATVNGQPITRLSVIQELEKQSGKRALENIITKNLIMQEGKKKHITVTDKDVDDQMKKIEKNISAQGMTLDQALQAQNMTKDGLKSELKVQIVVQKLVGDKVNVTDKEVEDYQNTNKEATQQNAGQEQSKEQIREQLKQQKTQKVTQQYVDQLRKNAKVTYFTSY